LNRRGLLFAAGAGALMVAALAGCASTAGGGGITFATIQGYVSDADAALDKLVPLVTTLDPSAGAALASIQAEADGVAATFGGLSSSTGAGSAAQQIVTLIGDGLTIAAAIPGLPPTDAAAIDAAELLLVAISSFFGVSATPTAAAALGHPDVAARLLATARAAYTGPPDAMAADGRLRAWLASR
jgi:hypothetical protein